MADCELCGRAEVSLVPVLVPSDFSPYRESGTWTGICARCAELCRSGSGVETLAGSCALCHRTVAGLASLSLERPSVAGPKAFTAHLCRDCASACRALSLEARREAAEAPDASKAPFRPKGRVRKPMVWAFQ